MIHVITNSRQFLAFTFQVDYYIPGRRLSVGLEESTNLIPYSVK